MLLHLIIGFLKLIIKIYSNVSWKTNNPCVTRIYVDMSLITFPSVCS